MNVLRYCYIIIHPHCGYSSLKPLFDASLEDGGIAHVFLCLHCGNRFAVAYRELDVGHETQDDDNPSSPQTNGANGKVIPFPKPKKE